MKLMYDKSDSEASVGTKVRIPVLEVDSLTEVIISFSCHHG